LRPVNADIPSRDYFDARAPRVQRARPVARRICAPGAQKPTCIWEFDEIGGAKLAVRRIGCALRKRPQPAIAVCFGGRE